MDLGDDIELVYDYILESEVATLTRLLEELPIKVRVNELDEKEDEARLRVSRHPPSVNYAFTPSHKSERKVSFDYSDIEEIDSEKYSIELHGGYEHFNGAALIVKPKDGGPSFAFWTRDIKPQ